MVAALPVEVSGRGRQVDQLQFTAPGTTGDTFSHRVSGGVDFEQEIVYNGIPAPQPETEGYTTNFNPPFELVQEYRVEKSTFSAQFGLGQGALTYQMASGTNAYHGDLVRDQPQQLVRFRRLFQRPAWNAASQQAAYRSREQLRLHHRRARSGFPTSMTAATRRSATTARSGTSRTTKTPTFRTVPTVQEKSGDFSDYVDAAGNVIPIYDTSGRSGSASRSRETRFLLAAFSPLSQSLLQYIPDPDRPARSGGCSATRASRRSSIRTFSTFGASSSTRL